MNAVNVPVTITPEAAARVDELGFQAELERMIQYALQAVPELQRIDVERYVRADEDSPPAVKVIATTAKPWAPTDRLYWDVVYWQVDTIPPQVGEHLSLTVEYLTSADAS
ncbi:MAG: hypothetical protein U0797_09855 [Gemmataceae bacterium]